MSEISERVRGRMWVILHNHKKEEEWSGVIADLCAIPGLAIVDRNADLPETHVGSPEGVPIRFIQDVRREGWVKEIKEN